MTSEWRRVKFSEIIEIIGGGTPKTSVPEYWNGSIPWLSVADFNCVPRWVSATEKHITKRGLEESSTKLLNTGDIIISARGTVGAIAQLTRPMTFNQSCYGIRGVEGLSNTDYVFYALKFAVDQFKRLAHGGVFDTITRDTFHTVDILLPPLREQMQIASLLGSLDDRITLLRETNKTLEAIAQALFKSWFVDFDPVRAKMEGKQPEGMDEATAALFPDSFEESELGLVPKGWSDATLSTVATFQNGYAFKSSDWSEVGHPVVKIGNVKPLHIDFDGCSYVSPQTVVGLERFKLSAGDLLVGMTGYVGEAGLVPRSDTTSYLNQRVGRIMTKNGLRDLGFVFSAVRQKEFKNFAVSQSHGSAQANVSGADLMKFPVTVPSTDVLEKYNEITYQFIASILNNHSEATLLTSLRDTLLPRLISGQLPIADAETELEKALA